MSLPKTGVLTFHRCINYGSYWQARCLVEGLRARGLDALLLEHQSRRVDIAEWRCAFRPQLPAPTITADYPRYRQKIEKFFEAFEALPLSRPFPLEDPGAMEEFDAVVVGSDEVWNLRHPWYAGSQLFYGVGVQARLLIAYAASFGNQMAEWGLDDYWAERLQQFDAIAVRDDNSRRIVATALGSEPPLVLDPCLQFDPTPEGSYEGPQDKFVAVYGHNLSPAFVENVRGFAKSRALKLVSIGYRNDWCDESWIEAGPHDFAHFMARAEAVATNFFHGCVFALRGAKPFVCETSDYRSVKVQNLMHTVGALNHLTTPETTPETYAALLSQPLETSVETRIQELRASSHQYLDTALAPLYGRTPLLSR